MRYMFLERAMYSSAFLSVFVCLILCTGLFRSVECRSFTIDYKNDCFLKDDKPFRYVSGGMHYFRVPSVHWKDRLLKMKAAGLNAVQTYIAWNIHEPKQGQYNFEGDADLVNFIKVVNETGLLLILRPGPYICAEWDFGGFPAWLMKNSTSIILRSSKDPAYTSAVTSWFSVLLPKLKPYLYSNGGPIISAQVENEYGSSKECDHKYMEYLQSLFEEFLGKDIVLFTVDGDAESYLKCGTIPSLYSTVDFGAGDDPSTAFAAQRKYEPHGPLVNTEYYAGWFDLWGFKHRTGDPAVIANVLDKMLALNASVNFYMFEGGSNFGFMNGATTNGATSFVPITTSYDYDAPLSEAGDPTKKYYMLRDVIRKYLPIPKMPVPPPTPKHAYGKVMMHQVGSLWNILQFHLSSAQTVRSTYPQRMEQLGFNYGFVLYITTIKYHSGVETRILSLPGVRDRAIVFLDNERVGVVNRNDKSKNMTVHIDKNRLLGIFVENQGRFIGGIDPKGLISNVTIDGKVLTDWSMAHLEDWSRLKNVVMESEDQMTGLFQGIVPPMPDGKPPQDTYLLMSGWGKGQAYLNGMNLGRYWPTEGPQETLYVPKSAFKESGANELTLFEVDSSPCIELDKCYVEMVTAPILNGTVANIVN